MKLAELINKCNNVGCITISGLCSEYYGGIDELKKKGWYKEARDRRVLGISITINGHMEPELMVEIE
ncbi:MAG: hypothetical protein IJ567_06360 [Lachnospiraceae bacterium]|nr:hypothetical protein [Lachnospiraceae bacterium]